MTDKNTGKRYTVHNIPVDKVFIMVLPGHSELRIMNENYGHESDVWYDGTFCGDRYAVFERTVESSCWMQITPWYQRFGYAQRKMFERYNKNWKGKEV